MAAGRDLGCLEPDASVDHVDAIVLSGGPMLDGWWQGRLSGSGTIVWKARQMLARGEGYLLQTASAAGLLTQVGSAPYSVTKHAAVAFAEWLSITYGDKGIKVSCLCPQGVRTRMLLGEDGKGENFLVEGSVSPEEVAEAVVAGLAAEKFLILPHAEVAEYFQRKATDYDRWIRGMRRLQAKVL